MRISDWSSDVCSSDLHAMTWLPSPLDGLSVRGSFMYNDPDVPIVRVADKVGTLSLSYKKGPVRLFVNSVWTGDKYRSTTPSWFAERLAVSLRSEEHTSELQSLMRISYAVFCLKKKTHRNQ